MKEVNKLKSVSLEENHKFVTVMKQIEENKQMISSLSKKVIFLLEFLILGLNMLLK